MTRRLLAIMIVSLLFMGVFCTVGMQPGQLMKLCPPGDTKFIVAYSWVCGMKKKKRESANNSHGSSNWLTTTEAASQFNRYRRLTYRKATIKDIMKICCYAGCGFEDLAPYCDPFSFKL